MHEDRIYYEDQSAWTPMDFQTLWRYLNRLLQFIGPTQAALENPEALFAQIERKRAGRRDDELEAMDLERMSPATRYLLRHMLIHMNRYELALDRYPNLRGLAAVEPLEHPLVLSDDPTGVNPYYTSVGILL